MNIIWRIKFTSQLQLAYLLTNIALWPLFSHVTLQEKEKKSYKKYKNFYKNLRNYKKKIISFHKDCYLV